MSSIQIDVSEVVKKLDPKEMDQAIAVALTGAAETLQADMETYPPKPATSRYVRTFNLMHSWNHMITRNPLSAIIGSFGVPYAHWVQGEDQAWMHVGRWQTVTQVAKKRTEDVKRFIEGSLERWAKR